MIKNIMLVDDSAFMRTIIKNVLTKNGYSIIGEAENGKIAVELYSKLKPDVVFMDVVMPEMNGIESVKNIKANDPNARIIMCSSSGQQAVVMEAINAGIEQTNHLPLLLDIDKAQKFHEAEQQILGIANELAVLGRG